MMPAPTTASGSLHRLGPVTRIPPGEGRVFDLGCAAVAVFRTRGGRVFATQAHCPHKGGPLADGVTGSGLVVCPLHGFKFDLATGRAVGNVCESLRTYAVFVTEDGDLALDVGVAPAGVDAGALEQEVRP